MKRSTPWVDGCCGPMFSVISSVRSVVIGRLWLEPNDRALSDGGNAVILLRLDEILTQRMTDPIFRHQQAAKIAMPREVDAEEIVDLALHPVRRLPHNFERGDGGILARKFHLQHDLMAILV